MLISEQTVFHRFLHIIMNMKNIILYKYIYFMLTCVQTQFKVPSREIGRLLSNRLSTMRFKLEISNVKSGLKKCVFVKKCCCFFPINTEYMISRPL